MVDRLEAIKIKLKEREERRKNLPPKRTRRAEYKIMLKKKHEEEIPLEHLQKIEAMDREYREKNRARLIRDGFL